MVQSTYFTHHLVLAAGTRHALEDVGNDGVGIQIELGLKRESQWRPSETLRTHIEDLEEPIQVILPRRNHILVIPGVDKSAEPVPPASFDDLFSYFRNGPGIRRMVSRRTRDLRRIRNSRR